MAQEVNIKLLGTSDIHGRVVPWSYGADVEDKSGSYAQIATYVKDVRKNNKNVVLVDVGDAIQDNQVDVFAKILQRSPNSKSIKRNEIRCFRTW